MHGGKHRARPLVTVIKLTCCLAATGLLASPAGAGQPGARPRWNGSTPPLAKALQHLVTTPGGPPGAIALVQVGGQIQVTTAGVGNVVTREPISANDTVRIASVSKAFSGAVALALVAQGRLSLDDTIGRWLPYLPRAWATVTLAELLHHTSGLPDYIKSPAFLELLKADPHVDLTPVQLLSYVADQRLLFQPGCRYDYSDSDNIVVGLMVEAATHGSYESALANDVTTPLRLVKTTLPADASLTEPYVHGYDIEAGTPPVDVSTLLNPALAWASGGMLSTPAELNQFMRAYVKGTLTDPTTRNRQFEFVPGNSGPPGPGVNSAGLAIFRYQTGCGTVYGHTGNFPGYTIFAAATSDGSRSTTVIVNEQLNDNPVTPAFTMLQEAEGVAVCAAIGS
ncbi:MAG: serine hydrolase domain-containing protein [Acidimicrobiales bacterium]|jgi:D-alanyl-D-alanine carboxypeptidase